MGAAVAVAALLAGVEAWQQVELSHLRSQLAAESAALQSANRQVAGLSDQLSAAAGNEALLAGRLTEALAAARTGSAQLQAAATFWQHDERALILNRYRAVLAGLDLSPETRARLDGLLVDLDQAYADAHEAARQEGFADGTPGMNQAVIEATAGLIQEVTALVGTEVAQRVQAMNTAPAAPAVVVENIYEASPEALAEPAPVPVDNAPPAGEDQLIGPPVVAVPFGFVGGVAIAPPRTRSFGGHREHRQPNPIIAVQRFAASAGIPLGASLVRSASR